MFRFELDNVKGLCRKRNDAFGDGQRTQKDGWVNVDTSTLYFLQILLWAKATRATQVVVSKLHVQMTLAGWFTADGSPVPVTCYISIWDLPWDIVKQKSESN